MDVLNMQLETVRIVLQNEINEISVCVDLKRRTGVFYTVISITDPGVRRRVASMLAAQDLFADNRDFVGSYSHGESLNLVFLYRDENLLSRQESLYATSFVRRRTIAENLVVSLAEAQIAETVGPLLLADCNLNVAPDLSVYFNYFLDFQKWNPARDEGQFYQKVSQAVFGVLSRDYDLRFEGQIDSYPSELQAFFKKSQAGGFRSYSGILSALKQLPDQPEEPKVGMRKLVGKAGSIREWLKQHGTVFFVALLLVVTMIYAGYQITMRLSYRSAAKKNTVFSGLVQIGDVLLGDETI